MANFEAMVVKAELDTVRNEIRKCIRDGVVIRLTYSELHEPITLDEYKEFETHFRSVWGSKVSVIEATYLTPQMTELRLLPVTGIYNDEETNGVWQTLRRYFKQQGLNDEKETLSTPYELRDVAESVATEKRLRESTLPKLSDEQEFKNKWRKFYRANKVHNRLQLDADSGRFMTADEIEIEVEQDWRREQEEIEILQERWHEIHSFDRMTLKEATKIYLAQNIPSETATLREQSQDARPASTYGHVTLAVTTSGSVAQLDDGKLVEIREWRSPYKSPLTNQQTQNLLSEPTVNQAGERHKLIISALLVSGLALFLILVTLLVVFGFLPQLIGLVLWIVALSIGGATNSLSQFLTIREKLFPKR